MNVLHHELARERTGRSQLEAASHRRAAALSAQRRWRRRAERAARRAHKAERAAHRAATC